MFCCLSFPFLSFLDVLDVRVAVVQRRRTQYPAVEICIYIRSKRQVSVQRRLNGARRERIGTRVDCGVQLYSTVQYCTIHNVRQYILYYQVVAKYVRSRSTATDNVLYCAVLYRKSSCAYWSEEHNSILHTRLNHFLLDVDRFFNLIRSVGPCR
jgi:hypothetical protein